MGKKRKANKKRGPYQRRLHKPLYPNVGKTTTPQGFKDYMRNYMRDLRKLKREMTK